MKKFLVGALSLAAITTWSVALLGVTAIEGQTTNQSTAQHSNLPKLTNSKTPWEERKSQNLTANIRSNKVLTRLSPPQVLGEQTSTTSPLTQEQIIFLDKPGVVCVINWLSGELSLPDFDINLKTFALTPRPDLKPTVFKDMVAHGSGFVVNPDGYIITNAHVASKNSLYEQLEADMTEHFKKVYAYQTEQLSDKEYKDYEHYLDLAYGPAGAESDAKMTQVANKAIAAYVKNNSVDSVTPQLVVVDKSKVGAKLTENYEMAEIYKKGLEARTIDFDENFKDSLKDVALIKVSGKNFPGLPLGSSLNLTTGEKTIILGYPHNAQISAGDFFEPTLTVGTVGAIKKIHEQKVIQLDNKISPGSSGGPLLDGLGNVVGIVTYETGDNNNGDSFGFALPVELAKDLLDKHHVTNDLGVYGANLLLGLASLENNTCKKALEYFDAAGKANSHFLVKEQLAKPINQCQNLIAAKQSKDTPWDILRIFYQEHKVNAMLLSLMALTILAFGLALVLHLLRHLHKQRTSVFSSPSHDT